MTKGSLRKALAGKTRTSAEYRVVVSDTTDADKALSSAVREQRLATARHEPGSPEVAAADVAVAEARKQVEGCFYPIRLQSLPPHQFEGLLSQHEPTEQQVKEAEAKGLPRPSFDVDALVPALVAACSVEQDMTEQEWTEELTSERWSAAERNELFDVALAVNTRGRSQHVPFG